MLNEPEGCCLLCLFSKLYVAQIENADFYIRKKDVSKASAGLAEAKTALDTVLSKLA